MSGLRHVREKLTFDTGRLRPQADLHGYVFLLKAFRTENASNAHALRAGHLYL